MMTGSTTTDAGPLRASAADPDAHERERGQGRIETPTDAQQGREAGSRESTDFAHIWQLFGYAILDTAGTKVGPVARVWTDTASGRLRYVGLTTGRVRRQTRVIPAWGARIDDRDRSIRVGYLAETIRNAPCYNTDVNLTSDQERKVGTYYDNH